jgi:tetratricopeptide (TPR) repeat protein
MNSLLWMVLAAARAQTVLPGSSLEVVFEGDATAEIEGAMSDLRAGSFDDAARRLQALVDAGGGGELAWLLGLARYEAGQLALAEDAVRRGLRTLPDDPRLLVLLGLVQADQGRGDLALATLARAETGARSDPDLTARLEIDRALVHLDRGEPDLAEAALARAEALVAKGADPALAAVIAADRAEVAALRGQASTDPLAAVGEALSRGDLAAAVGAIPPAGPDRRSQIRHLLAEGAVARAEGRVDAARTTLDRAATQATEAGLVRERAAALASLGVVYTTANRPETARQKLEEALALVGGTSLRVLELSYRVEAGRAALRAGDPAGAAGHLAKAKALQASTKDAGAAARVAELAGLIAAGEGDAAAAAAAYQQATSAYQARGAHADVARVGCLWIEAVAGRDEAETTALVERTLAAFRAAGDPLGPAHVGNAEGLGRAARHDLEGAMNAFVAAAADADAARSDRGRQIAAIARENAARTVAEEVGSEAVLREASRWGLEELVEKRGRYVSASADYEAARQAYDRKQWREARDGFDRATKALEGLGESGRAALARRGRAWAEYNDTLAATPLVAYPTWQKLVEEATLLGDAELRARARGAGALAAADLKRPEAAKLLQVAATEAEQMGLRGLAGQCRAALVPLTPALADKVAAARQAFVLRGGDAEGQHALYQAAYAAYQADDYDTAIALCDEVRPLATGALRTAVDELLSAARQARGE